MGSPRRDHEQTTPENLDTTPAVSRRQFLQGTGAAALGTAAIQVPAAAQQDAATPDASPATGAAGEPAEPAILFFNAQESALVDALTTRLIPGTPDDPGAREAGVLYYIDRSLAGTNMGYTVKTYTQGPFLAMTEQQTEVEATSRTDIYRTVPVGSETASRYGYQSVMTPQDIYRRGLQSVEDHALATFDASFVDLSPDQQDSILEAMEADEIEAFQAPSGQAFFTKLRNDTIEGMFSDPMYGGNRDMAGWRLIGYPGARGFYTPEELANESFSTEPVSLADSSGHHH